MREDAPPKLPSLCHLRADAEYAKFLAVGETQDVLVHRFVVCDMRAASTPDPNRLGVNSASSGSDCIGSTAKPRVAQSCSNALIVDART